MQRAANESGMAFDTHEQITGRDKARPRLENTSYLRYYLELLLDAVTKNHPFVHLDEIFLNSNIHRTRWFVDHMWELMKAHVKKTNQRDLLRCNMTSTEKVMAEEAEMAER